MTWTPAGAENGYIALDYVEDDYVEGLWSIIGRADNYVLQGYWGNYAGAGSAWASVTGSSVVWT